MMDWQTNRPIYHLKDMQVAYSEPSIHTLSSICLKIGVEPKVPSGRTFWPKAVFYLRKITEGNFNLRFAEDRRPKVIIFMTARKKISRRFFWAQPQLSSFIRLGVIKDSCRKHIEDFDANRVCLSVCYSFFPPPLSLTHSVSQSLNLSLSVSQSLTLSVWVEVGPL